MSLLFALAAAAALPAAPVTVAPAPAGTSTDDATSSDAHPKPASLDAILEGVKACIGITGSTTDVSTRFAGWPEATDDMSAEKVKEMRADNGRMLMRDNVRVALKPGADGFCIAGGGIAPGFDRAALETALSRLAGTAIKVNEQPVAIANNERLSIELGERMVLVFVTGPKGLEAMQGKNEP